MLTVVSSIFWGYSQDILVCSKDVNNNNNNSEGVFVVVECKIWTEKKRWDSALSLAGYFVSYSSLSMCISYFLPPLFPLPSLFLCLSIFLSVSLSRAIPLLTPKPPDLSYFKPLKSRVNCWGKETGVGVRSRSRREREKRSIGEMGKRGEWRGEERMDDMEVWTEGMEGRGEGESEGKEGGKGRRRLRDGRGGEGM